MKLPCLADFLTKVKEGKVKSFASSGFGGKGLDRLDKERDAKERAERSAYGEGGEEKAAVKEEPAEGAAATKDADGELPFEFKVEIKRGPAPDTSKMAGLVGPTSSQIKKAREDEKMYSSNLKAAEEAAAKLGKDTDAFRKAQMVVAKLNAQVRATKLALQAQMVQDDGGRKPKDPDATDFHAIIPINDYPQKARWRVTNKETMVQLVDITGASVTNKGTGCLVLATTQRRMLTQIFRRHILRAREGARPGSASQAASSYRVERRVQGTSATAVALDYSDKRFTGGASCPRDQAPPHRGVDRRSPSRVSQPHRNWSLQRSVVIDWPLLYLLKVYSLSPCP